VNSEITETPTELAIRHIAEAHRLLATVVTSSESFDYPKAKQALSELEKKIRELGRAQAYLQQQETKFQPPNVVSFPSNEA
jgi:hypothetical protein